MIFHFNAFSITLLMAGVAALLVSLLIFQRIGSAIKWFSLMMLCISVWAIAYGFELSSSTLPQMLFWIDIEYIGIAFAPTTWIVFVIKFIGKEHWLTLKNKLIIFSFPTLAVLLVWTNQWHHIHYSDVSVNNEGPFPLLAFTPGPWYYIHTVYFYFMLAWGIYLLFSKFKKADSVYRKQNALVITGALIPWMVNFIYLLGVRPYQYIDLTPYAFILTSIMIGFGLLRYNLFDVVPMAREKVIEGMREGMLVLDSSNRVIDINTGMKEFLSDQSSHFIGTTIHDVLPEQEDLYRAVEKKINNKLDVKLVNKRGNRFFEVDVTPLSEKGTLLIFWDITERKMVEDKLIEQAQQLIALNQLKDRIFSVIAHDLRSPLASLVNMVRIAESEDISEEEFKLFLPAISKNVGYTSSLLENLLYWSKSQLKGEAIHQELFDLKTITKSKNGAFEKRLTEKNISLEDTIPENTFLYADKNMITLVLSNLIGNAIKFCQSGDKITLTAVIDQNYTTVCVSDTGIGIKKEIQSKLFGTEISSVRGTENEQGTGLGLIICKDFIEQNGGKIWVESTPGEGSRFYFALRNTSPEPM